MKHYILEVVNVNYLSTWQIIRFGLKVFVDIDN